MSLEAAGYLRARQAESTFRKAYNSDPSKRPGLDFETAAQFKLDTLLTNMVHMLHKLNRAVLRNSQVISMMLENLSGSNEVSSQGQGATGNVTGPPLSQDTKDSQEPKGTTTDLAGQAQEVFVKEPRFNGVS